MIIKSRKYLKSFESENYFIANKYNVCDINLDFLNKITIDNKFIIIKNYNSNNLIEQIKSYINNSIMPTIIIENYDIELPIAYYDNFFVVDNYKLLLTEHEIKTLYEQNRLNINAKPILNNNLTLGFINYNLNNNNNTILLKNAIKTFYLTNKSLKESKIIIINSGNTDYYIKDTDFNNNNNIKIYDFNTLNNEKFNSPYKQYDLDHMNKIDKLIKLTTTEKLILCDCDIKFIKSISKYIKMLDSYDVIGTVQQNRIVPFLLFLNLKTLKSKHIYFADYVSYLNNVYKRTGEDLLNICNNKQLTFNHIDIYELIQHYGAASYIRLNKSTAEYPYQLEYIKSDVINMSINDFIG